MAEGVPGRQLTRRAAMTTGAKVAAGAAALWALEPSARAAEGATTVQVTGPPYDFTDHFYRANGIDPTRIVLRVDGTPPDSTHAPRQDPFPGFSFASDTDPHLDRHVRILNTTTEGTLPGEGQLQPRRAFGWQPAPSLPTSACCSTSRAYTPSPRPPTDGTGAGTRRPWRPRVRAVSEPQPSARRRGAGGGERSPRPPATGRGIRE